MRIAARQRGKNCRKLHTKNSAALLPVVAEYLSGVLLNDAETNAQPEAGALADRLRGVKRIEHAAGILDARPGVGEKHNHVSAIADIVDDVEEHLHELVAVTPHTGQNRF